MLNWRLSAGIKQAGPTRQLTRRSLSFGLLLIAALFLAYVDELRSQVCDLWDTDGGAGGRAYLLGRAAERGAIIRFLEARAKNYYYPVRGSLADILDELKRIGSSTTSPVYPDQLRLENEQLRAALLRIVETQARDQDMTVAVERTIRAARELLGNGS